MIIRRDSPCSTDETRTDGSVTMLNDLILKLTNATIPSSPSKPSSSPMKRSSTYGGSNGELFSLAVFSVRGTVNEFPPPLMFVLVVSLAASPFSCCARILASASAFAFALSFKAGQMRIWNYDRVELRSYSYCNHRTCPSFILLDILDFTLEKVERSRLTSLFELWTKIGDSRSDRSVHASLRSRHDDRLWSL